MPDFGMRASDGEDAMKTDHAGHAVSGATQAGLEAYEQAAHEFRCMIADPVATIDRAIEACPAMPMAYVLKGWLMLLGTEPEGLPVARDCARRAEPMQATDRERAHVEAVRAAAHGHWREAGRRLEDVAARWPHDALALQAGHQIDFLCGDARMLRDRIARAIGAWSESMPAYHALLGMYAFGLEETGDYERAERFGRRAVELQPRDGWAWHAVAHVHEMRNRPSDGIAWLAPNAATWSHDSFLAVHNWWHLALFHLERDDVDEVLRLYDGPIFGSRSAVVFDLLDATAMLWRLTLRGVDVGDRWEAVAQRWLPIAQVNDYAFNDVHAAMSFVCTGRNAECEHVVARQRGVLRQAEEAAGDNAFFLREVGHDATRAIAAFGDGRYAECVRLLRRIRNHAHRFGGSHAQRDVLDLTLIEAAIRSGDRALAQALAAERAALRPHSPPTRRLVQRAGAIRPALGETERLESAAA